MLLFDGAGGFIVLAVWIFCFIDVVVTPETQCRNLPKLAWVFVVLLLPFLGSIAWLVAGHPWDKSGQTFVSNRSSSRWSDRAEVPHRAGAAAGPRKASNPDDDEEFLAGLRKRAEEQRRRAREQDERGDKI